MREEFDERPSYSALAGLWVVEDECLVGLFCSWEKAYDRLLLFMPLCLCCLSPFGAVYAVYAISSLDTGSPLLFMQSARSTLVPP